MKRLKTILTVAMIVFVSLPCVTSAHWNAGDPHKMHFPQLPDPNGWDVYATSSDAGIPVVVADDWRCSDTGWVKDIHFWGSWKGDQIGTITSFHLSIHADIPASESPTGYSMPGKLLWEADIFPGQWLEAGPSSGSARDGGFWVVLLRVDAVCACGEFTFM